MLVLVLMPKFGEEGPRLHEGEVELGRRVQRPIGRCRHAGYDVVEVQGAGEDVERVPEERAEQAEEEREELADGRVPKPA